MIVSASALRGEVAFYGVLSGGWRLPTDSVMASGSGSGGACWERGPRGRTKVRSTECREACMLEATMKQPVPVVVKDACRSGEGDGRVRNAGVCEGETVLPESV